MNLDKLNIPSNVKRNLEKNDLTMQKLATASPSQLSVIPGIGQKTAESVIKAAREVVNTELLKESAMPEYRPSPPEPTQRSVRVRRIYGETV